MIGKRLKDGPPFRLAGLLLVLAAGAVTIEAASISGRVFDADNQLYVESARITLVGAGQTVTSERGGLYRMGNVDPGEYSLIVEASGLPRQVKPVRVEDPNAEMTVNFSISRDEVFELEELVVEGTAIGAAKSLDIRRSARDYREVVASDAFGQFADRNPAEALQRVAGITTESDQGEGSFLIVRGSAPELSNVQIDGVNLATPEEDGRRVNLNIITNDQLERIEVSKTWLPSQKGNVIGGTVNLVTRSALDRGERFLSLEGAATQREVQDGETSWRGALTYGDILDEKDWQRFGEMAIGFQFSINQAEDFSGSDTVSWTWNTSKDYPFLTRPGTDEERLRGYTLQTVNLRNFDIQRERLGASSRLEFRLNRNHEIRASISHNRFDDLVNEHIFSMQQSNSAQFYSGTRFSEEVAAQLGLDPADPFNRQRIQSSTELGAALTYNEALAIGEIVYDPETKLFMRGGRWAMPMDRTFVHTERNDQIDTYQFEGVHRLPAEVNFDWKAYSSEAEQESIRHWLRFSTPGSTGAGAIPIAGVTNPYLEEPGDSPAVFNKTLFRMEESTTGTATIRQLDLTTSLDERQGIEFNLEKRFEIGSTVWLTRIGYMLDEREKSYQVNPNDYGLRGGALDPDLWGTRGRVSLDDPYFDGGEVEGFSENFGPGLRFGPSFDNERTLAFLEDPAAMGVAFSQSVNHVNNNVSARVQSNYQATEDITGLYWEQSVDWRKWNLIFGLRNEETKNSFTNLEIITRNPDVPIAFITPALWRALIENFGEVFSREVTTERTFDHLLPAVHLSRQIGDNARVRSSVTKTIARPLFSDLVPREIPAVSSGTFLPEIRLPAFDLVPMESVNYDLSLDLYFSPVGLFSVAVFHKDIDGPIFDETRIGVGPNEETEIYELKYNPRNARIDPENIQPTDRIVNDNAYRFSRKRNAGKAELYGVEVTFNRKLNFLPGFLNGLGVYSNVAFFESKAVLPTELRLDEEVRLFRQPDMTANAAIYYEKHGLFARLSYNIRGKYLESISAGDSLMNDLELMEEPLSAMDIWVDRRARLDFTLRYNLTPHLQIFVEAVNLTNEPELRIRGNETRPHSRQYTERIFTIGAKWNI